MGASRRRIDRRLSRSPRPPKPLAVGDHPLLLPAVSVAYAALIAAMLLAADELVQLMPGVWFNLLGITLLGLSMVTVVVLLRTAWRRHGDQLDRRAAGWVATAVVAALVGVVAGVELVDNAQLAAQISGADVHLTRPVIEALPRPPGTTILSEQPGLAGTESISEQVRATNLDAVIPFYTTSLTRAGWVKDSASASATTVRFARGTMLVSIDLDPGSGTYSVTVDQVNPDLFASPSPSAAQSP
jgi:hypothetical protein